MATLKNLYRGTFNLSQTVMVERVQAHTERQAWFLFCQRIARRREVPVRNITKIFDGTRPNFDIKLEMTFEESDE